MYKSWVILYKKKRLFRDKTGFEFLMGHRIDSILNLFKEKQPHAEILQVFVEYNPNYFKDEKY